MLPKEYRLRRSADIRRVRRHGQRWQHPLLLLFAAPADRDVSRFAVSVSKKVGTAIVRNRSKRRIREAIRRRLDDVRPGWDCLLVVRATLPEASFEEVEAAVCQLLSQADLLNEG